MFFRGSRYEGVTTAELTTADGRLIQCKRVRYIAPGPAATPQRVFNRPGLSALAYRIGSFGSFREAMLEAIAKQPELSRLTTRESVSEVLIQDIPFQLNSERPDVAAIRLERFCARVVIERCTVENRAAPCCALVIHDGAEITIADNRLLSFLVGALVFGFCDRLKSVGNRVSGLGATTADPAPVGLCGICIGVEPAGSNLICRIENNLIEEFLIGVHLGRGADGSVVAENRILRSERSDFSEVPDTAEKLRAYAKERFYAAFLAAQAGSKVTMPFVLDAARTEFRKLERPINEADFRVLEAVGRKA